MVPVATYSLTLKLKPDATRWMIAEGRSGVFAEIGSAVSTKAKESRSLPSLTISTKLVIESSDL